LRRRIVLTGIGLVAPNAIGKEAFWKALADGKSGIKRIARFDVSSYETQIAGEIQDFKPDEYMSPKDVRRTSLAAQFALASAKMAMSDAKLQIEEKSRFGVILGVSSSAADIIEAYHGAFMEKGASRINPFGVTAILPSAAANNVAITFGCKGTVMTISNSCAAGTDAIGSAFHNISLGKNDIFIAGGTESQLTPFGLAMLTAPRIMSKRNNDPEGASRPFDKTRDGGILSEGAGLLILEELEYAQKRGAHIYAEILAYASRADGVSSIDPQSDDTGIERSISMALSDANISPDEIDYVCAHGPSDSFDIIETKAIKKNLGDHAYKIPVSSIKSMIGNPLSAAGPLQIIASAMVFERGIIPPTINLESPEDDCDLDYVPKKARKSDNINTILINSHGFGGVNSSIIIRKFN
jgi:3-oxoacyl-[acyl-carrier-protein] synthase II